MPDSSRFRRAVFPGDLIFDFSSRRHGGARIPWDPGRRIRWSDFSDTKHMPCARSVYFHFRMQIAMDSTSTSNTFSKRNNGTQFSLKFQWNYCRNVRAHSTFQNSVFQNTKHVVGVIVYYPKMTTSSSTQRHIFKMYTVSDWECTEN